MARKLTFHGSAVDDEGIGLMLFGESGTGKSDTVLQFLESGASLVADDVVEITREGAEVYASAPFAFRGLLNIRGVGMIDAAELFGRNSVVVRKRIDLCISLAGRDSGHLSSSGNILGVEVPVVNARWDERDFALLARTIERMRNRGVSDKASQVFERHDRMLQLSIRH